MSYTIEAGQVFFYDSRLRDADAETFEVLSEDFARDKNAVYVNRKRFAEGDPASLVVLPKREGHPTQFAYDARHVYKTNLPAIVKDLDGASFRALDPHYGSDGSRVYSFDTERVLKRADPGTFEVLGHGYARDKDSVFFVGERVTAAHAASFHVLGPRMASDEKGVFWEAFKIRGVPAATFRSLAGNYYASGANDVLYYDKPVRGARAASLEVLAPDYARDASAVYFGASPIAAAEPETFELLGASYARDRRHVFFGNTVVDGADAPTFAVVDGRASDRHKTYIGVRGAEKAPDLGEPVGAPEIEALARAVFTRWVEVLFPVLDSVKSNDWNFEMDSIDPAPGAAEALADHRLEVDGSRLRVTYGGFTFEGSFSGYLTLLGGLWAVARKKVVGATPCVRLFDERGVSGPEGDIVVTHVTKKGLESALAVFDLLTRAKLTDEATLVLYQILKVVEYDNSPEGVAVQHKLHQRVPESRLTDLSYYTLRGVTSGRASPQSFIKRLIQSPYLSSPNTLDRVRAAEFFHQNLGEVVYSNLLNFNKLVPPFLPLLDDPHPLVRDLMWQNLDFLVSKLFYEHAYRACLEYLPRLIERGINLDINLARRWECYLAIGEDEKAAADWQALETIVSRYDRAPAQYTGLHTDYPSFEFWQVAGYLRLANAHRLWAKGKDPCEDVVIRKPRQPDKATRNVNVRRADAFIDAARQAIDRLSREYNAFEVGTVFAELVVSLNELTHEWDYGKASSSYVMHSQYVKHALEKRPYRLERADVVRAGLYQKDPRGFFHFAHATTDVSPVLGDALGIEYRLEGEPLSRTVPTVVNVFHQTDEAAAERGVLLATYEPISYIGMNNAFYWVFENPDEIKPGRWTIDLSIDPGGKSPLSIDRTFLVRAP